MDSHFMLGMAPLGGGGGRFRSVVCTASFTASMGARLLTAIAGKTDGLARLPVCR